jgi:DNA-binding GntR family transcriptional regulator
MTASAAGNEPEVHAVAVLADRIAAALVHREPGWRLPRRSALARRYNVSMGEVDAAIRDLSRRSLVRRLPDGQLYRASPADYWIPVEGATGVGTRLDPMGSPVECHAWHESDREAPQDVAWSVGVPAGEPVRVIRSVWTVAGDPGAVATTYLPRSAAPHRSAEDSVLEAEFGAILDHMPGMATRPVAVSVEMCPPQPSAARSLRLTPGQPVLAVTIRFEDLGSGAPTGLTVVLMRPELFRIAIDAGQV